MVIQAKNRIIIIKIIRYTNDKLCGYNSQEQEREYFLFTFGIAFVINKARIDCKKMKTEGVYTDEKGTICDTGTVKGDYKDLPDAFLPL